MTKTKTPEQISYFIKKCCKKIVPYVNLVWVQVNPEGWCQQNECFNNVKEKVMRDGGSIQYGWNIWEWKNVFVEAEFHSVWHYNNDLIDITPKMNNENKILFLIDDIRNYNGRRIDNMRFPLSKDRVITDYIKIAQILFNFIENGSHDDDPLISTFNRDDAKTISMLKDSLQKMLYEGLTENDPCFCGSIKKYKNCHSKMFV